MQWMKKACEGENYVKLHNYLFFAQTDPYLFPSNPTKSVCPFSFGRFNQFLMLFERSFKYDIIKEAVLGSH